LAITSITSSGNVLKLIVLPRLKGGICETDSSENWRWMKQEFLHKSKGEPRPGPAQTERQCPGKTSMLLVI